ncbi:MAG TPA: VOC family protein [Cyclobacteriaceae bacterium]|nr:VOC family protein [Cyclobacteriaceae bacterium]
MKLIPTLRCKDINLSLEFYTKVLGFGIKFTHAPDGQIGYAGIEKDGCEIHLSRHEGGWGTIVYVEVDEVDLLFREFVKRGLDNSHKKESPVHQGPTDQTWGMREFYIDDPSGNTLRFGCILDGNTQD